MFVEIFLCLSRSCDFVEIFLCLFLSFGNLGFRKINLHQQNQCCFYFLIHFCRVKSFYFILVSKIFSFICLLTFIIFLIVLLSSFRFLVRSLYKNPKYPFLSIFTSRIIEPNCKIEFNPRWDKRPGKLLSQVILRKNKRTTKQEHQNGAAAGEALRRLSRSIVQFVF